MAVRSPFCEADIWMLRNSSGAPFSPHRERGALELFFLRFVR